jgi:RNA polymerase sigma-70 factor (ECF subfamily)
LSDLTRAMSSLPGEQRRAMILVGAGGFSYKRAATMQGCATGTMKSRVSRGRQTVASLMMDNFALPPRAKNAGNAMQSIARDLAALSAIPRSRAH